MTLATSEPIRRAAYLVGALALIASQNLVAWWVIQAYGTARPIDLSFWLTPLAAALEIQYLSPFLAAAVFAYSLAVAWVLALLSFRLARQTNRGFILAVLSVVPIVQLPAIALNAVLPARDALGEKSPAHGHAARSVTIGLLSGVALIVLAVLVSAVTFGAYGWGLFVMTPFLVGATTGYLVNSREDLGTSRTMKLAILAAGLGSLALIVLALEGIACILLAAPLAVPVVMLGAALGRRVSLVLLERKNPIASVAFVPMVFMMGGAVPAEAPIMTQHDIVIAASTERVWQALTAAEIIRTSPGLPALAGLAHPIRSQLVGEGVGARRIGTFSTGPAVEVVTRWEPGETLAFQVERQPPAMEEMSPYRRVHAPHVEGYFTTGETRFELTSLKGGRTRLRIHSEHWLMIDPLPYWEPIARLAIRLNVERVLKDIKVKSEE